MKTCALPSLVLATLGLSACATAPVLRPTDSALRENLGRVSLVALTDSRQIRYQVPDTKADIAAEKLEIQPFTPRTVARRITETTGPIDYPASAIMWSAQTKVAMPIKSDNPFNDITILPR